LQDYSYENLASIANNLEGILPEELDNITMKIRLAWPLLSDIRKSKIYEVYKVNQRTDEKLDELFSELA